MLLTPLCNALGIDSTEDAQAQNTASHTIKVCERDTVGELLRTVVHHIGSLADEDARMRCVMSDSHDGGAFDRLRHAYRLRDELADVCIEGASGDKATILQSAGCQTV